MISGYHSCTLAYMHFWRCNHSFKMLPSIILVVFYLVLKVHSSNNNLIKYEVAFESSNNVQTLSRTVINANSDFFRVTIKENLPELRKGMLNITQLENLQMNNVNLQYMETGVFDNQNISHISLVGNKLTRIQSKMFNNLPTKTLYLGDNEITVIEKGAFMNMLQLYMLILSENKLTQISSGYFVNTPHISILDIGFNRITKIEDGCFGFMTEEDLTIRINHNAVDEIHPTGFENLNIMQLCLIENLIRDVPVELFTKNKIEMLQLDYNQVEELPDVFYGVNSTVEKLMLRSNPLKCETVEKLLEFSEKSGSSCFLDQDCYTRCRLN